MYECYSNRSLRFKNTNILLLQGELVDKVDSDKLVIALEPEAASLHCFQLPEMSILSSEDKITSKPVFGPGTKYLVVDAGGK